MSCENCNVCENEHEDEKEVNTTLCLIALVLFIVAFFIPNKIVQVILYAVSVILAGYNVLFEGIKNIFKLNFEEDTLMTIAVVAAFILGEYPEACLVIFLYVLGEYLEEKAVKKSKKNIEDIASLKENLANVEENGKIVTKNSKEVNVGDIILIKPGERIPLDSIIISGTTELDTSSITGESKPVLAQKNDTILSGYINLNGAIKAKVQKDLNHSVISEIANLVEEATENKGKSERFITRFSKIYTPTVICLSIAFAVITILTGMLDLSEGIRRSLVFLVASCPCSLVISVPLAFFTCIGSSSKKGMLIKGTKHIENLAKASHIAFDKTGTLTTGKMKLEKVEVLGDFTEKEILILAASLERMSTHPLSKAILEAVDGKELKEVQEYKEIAGHGICGKIDGRELLLGNKKLLEKYEVANIPKEDKTYLVVNGKLEGAIKLKEEILAENKEAVKNIPLYKIMLTGDSKENAEKIAKEYGINQIYARLLPNEKQEIIKKIKAEGKKVIFVGDGINDGPVLAEADFGISMGYGTEIANNISDAILMNNNIKTIPDVIILSKKTMRIVKTNITFSILIKLVVFVLGVAGIAPIWLAVLADTGVTFLTVLNSLRVA